MKKKYLQKEGIMENIMKYETLINDASQLVTEEKTIEQMSIIDGKISATDFYGRRFMINTEDGKIISKDIKNNKKKTLIIVSIVIILLVLLMFIISKTNIDDKTSGKSYDLNKWILVQGKEIKEETSGYNTNDYVDRTGRPAVVPLEEKNVWNEFE